MNRSPLVSVVMSVYNGEEYLHEAIRSILTQTYENFEFVIVNDGSSDNSLSIIEAYSDPRIILVNQTNTGLCRALNRGIAVSHGNFIARMDADDISHADRLVRQVDFLNSNPECVVVGSNANFIDMEGTFLYRSYCPLEWEKIKNVLPSSPFFHSATMFRKQAFVDAGCYFEEIRQFVEDKILWNRMAKIGQLRNLDAVLLDYRIVPGSITAGKKGIVDFDRIANTLILTNAIDPADMKMINDHRAAKVTSKEKLGLYYLRLGKIYLEHNFNRFMAIKMLVRSLIFSPLVSTTWFNLFLTLLPRLIIFQWKNSRGAYRKIW